MKYSERSDHSELPDDFANFTARFTVRSPGRINLIGEHTDYNNGLVLPTAIDKGLRLHFSENGTDTQCRIYSSQYRRSLTFDLEAISRSSNQWENYVLGVVVEILKLGKKIRGFDCVIDSNLPPGAGVSSSAALECGIAFGINELFNCKISRRTLAMLSRDAEHNYVGTRCGIMDQYASMLSKKDHLILLDCRSLEAAYVPFDIKGYKILLLNSNVSHNLADSQYNTRRSQCEKVVSVAREEFPEVESLREVTFDMLDHIKEALSEDLYQKALYVLQENDRVLQAVKAIKENDLETFGNLMYDSHTGLRDDFKVSCRELDFLVDFTKNFDTVIGSRMMGGGFGGCTINLVKADQAEQISTLAAQAYREEFNIELDAFSVLPEEGTALEK